MTLEATLRERRAAGRKLLVVYLTGGLDPQWLTCLEAVVAAGADAVEVGIPFSDPMIDGPVIQEASVRALSGGATPQGILAALRAADLAGTPSAVMTYYNIVLAAGHRRFAGMLASSGVSGAIVPDLPVDEAGPWQSEAEAAGVETVLLAAPTTPDSRLKTIGDRGRGFLYAVGLMGVTGERESLAPSAARLAERCKQVTDLPVLVGVGISTPRQAAEVCRSADGVVVGSALVRRLLDGEGPEGAERLTAAFRRALDEGG